MALVCSSSVIQYEDFEFIDCSTINISYSQQGMATVSLSVITTKKTLSNDYTNLSFDGVTYDLTTRDVVISLIPGTLVYTFQMTMVGFGC